MDDNIKITQNSVVFGDCLDVMKNIEDKSIDMILCDLPYGITVCKWDAIIPFDQLWEQYRRIIKDNGVIALTAVQPFTSLLICSNIEMFKYCWTWKKSKGSNFLHAPNMPLKVIEDICIFSFGGIKHKNESIDTRMKYNPQGTKKGSTFVKHNPNTSELKYHRESHSNHTTGYFYKLENYPTTLFDFKSDKGLHPTQKPVALFEYLIRTYTNENDLVLDNCAGSGTTAIACINTNRNYILIENNEKYYNIIKDRIKKRLEQTQQLELRIDQ